MGFQIIAIVNSISSNAIEIKGVAQYIFEDANKKRWCILEANPKKNDPPIFEISPIKIEIQSQTLLFSILSHSFFEQKPLKFILEKNTNHLNTYNINSISHYDNE